MCLFSIFFFFFRLNVFIHWHFGECYKYRLFTCVVDKQLIYWEDNLGRYTYPGPFLTWAKLLISYSVLEFSNHHHPPFKKIKSYLTVRPPGSLCPDKWILSPYSSPHWLCVFYSVIEMFLFEKTHVHIFPWHSSSF